MQTQNLRRALAGLALASLLAGCSGSDSKYPLVTGTLSSVTLVTDEPVYVQSLKKKGFTVMNFPPNYDEAFEVQAALWSVPQPAVRAAVLFQAPTAAKPDVRVLVTELAAEGREAEASTNEEFFKNVLGSEVPVLPEGIEANDAVRVQVWTYLIPSVIEANKRLRANNRAVLFDPVAITTPYMGDHQTMTIRAPDGTIIELVQTATQ